MGADEDVLRQCAGVRCCNSSPTSSTWRINANKYKRETQEATEYYISSFQDFSGTFAEIVQQSGASDYTINRVDFRVDSYENDWYDMIKWNYALMYGMKIQLGWIRSPRRWDTFGTTVSMFEGRSNGKGVRTYDRTAIAANKAPTKMRLELQHVEPIQSIEQIRAATADWDEIIVSSSGCYEQIQEDAAQDVIKDLKLEISNYEHTGTTYSGYGLLSKERDRIFSAREAVQIGAALGYSEEVTRQYLKRGTRPMNREWLAQEQLSEYSRKVAMALGRFMS